MCSIDVDFDVLNEINYISFGFIKRLYIEIYSFDLVMHKKI